MYHVPSLYIYTYGPQSVIFAIQQRNNKKEDVKLSF